MTINCSLLLFVFLKVRTWNNWLQVNSDPWTLDNSLPNSDPHNSDSSRFRPPQFRPLHLRPSQLRPSNSKTPNTTLSQIRTPQFRPLPIQTFPNPDPQN